MIINIQKIIKLCSISRNHLSRNMLLKIIFILFIRKKQNYDDM
jgi:hypothetical protein